jgi:hypothetical protein
MFDEVSFSYRMLNGRRGCNFQTKDLECMLDEYEATPAGRLVRVSTHDAVELPLGDLNYGGWLDIRDSVDHYRLDSMNRSLRTVQVMGEDGWLLFDPANCIEG